MIIICGVNSLYAGMILGWCWNIMQESWPEYKKANEIPYPEMARRAVGNWMRYTIMVFLVISQVGTCIVYLVLISKHIEGASSGKLKFCYMMILALFLITPLTWFRAPRNFWFMAIIDVFCSTLFILLLLIAFFIDKERIGPVSYPQPTFSSFTVSFGSLMFSYAGGGVYPTIQNDMKNRKLFPQSVFTGFLLIFILYIPFAILGYAAYGHTLGNDITETLMKNQNLKTLAKFLQVLSLAQLTTTLVIYLNPTFQLLEYLLECPKRKYELYFVVLAKKINRF
ncbi:hypothetical protein AVEN_113260-1 [Araneus ventricosus]|uniref:Amino acid transporter transmembrane domain-containing protein n=1 Tax=Araneus ventricosus TaxID=182803 RepID=A0A4Y2SR73_ARAVE|nr:hypothetical protein AVEN_113260-1 [Araneus ventricosus]